MSQKVSSKRALPIIRLFVSSTFSDLKHERNALHAQVWPELERYCQQRGFTFQAIDLRWGVPAEAGLDHRTMRICFEELRRSQDTSPEPNFLILLGNRYGWRPLPEVISVAEFERLKAAAEQIQSEPPDPARTLAPSQVELLKNAVAVLEDWYLLDENAKPFGEQTSLGEYVLRTRKTLLHGLDYGKYLNDDGKRQDTPAWINVQFVLWSIVNLAFPAVGLGDRFAPNKKGHDPSIVRFQASATEQEIWQGALQVDPQHAKEHVIAWFREIENLNDYPPGPQLKDFVDLKEDGTPDQGSKQALEQLTGELKRNLSGENIFESKCGWSVQPEGPAVPDVTTDHLDAMCKQIRKRLQAMIILQINAYWGCDLSADDATLALVRGSQQELDLECADHLRFAGERAPEKTFVGRESELQRIRDYLHSETTQPFVVHGPSGSGKTALLGKIIQEVTPPRNSDGTRAKSGPIVLTRFIGTTPESSNLRSLLSSLCRELRQDFEVTKTRKTPDGKTETFAPPLPTDLNELIDEFYSQLSKATAARPVFVFLDALDQLDAADHGRSVFWIRFPLPSTTDTVCHARMVVSCLSPSDEFSEDSEACEPFRELNVRNLLSDHELGALDENEARQLFSRWFHAAGRSVSETQQAMIWSGIQKSTACRQPLFLKVLFEEARRWRSFDPPSAIPVSLPLLLDELLAHLGKPTEHGELIGIALSCLVSARYGLSEGELLEILFTDEKYKTILAEDNQRNGHELPPDSNRIPIAPWTRLRSDLAAYLSERSAPGTAVMHFYHRQVALAARKRFLRTPDQQTSRYRQLANYFDGRWDRPDVHAMVELPHLRMLCQDHADLLRRLMGLQFPMRKTHAGYVSDLVQDYDNLRARVAGDTRDSLAPWYCFIRGNASFLGEHPASFFQQAYNEPVQSPVSKSAQHVWELTSGTRRKLFKTILRFAQRLWVLASGTSKQSASAFVPASFLEWLNRPTQWQPPACLMTLQGHTHEVNSVTISSDGSTIISGSSDQSVKVWDARTGECRATLRGHTSPVVSVAITDDGSTVVSGSGSILHSESADNSVKIWDARTGECRVTLQGHASRVHSVAFSSDLSTVVSGSEDLEVKVWDARTGACRVTLRGHTKGVSSVALSADGSTVISGSEDQTAKIWNAGTKAGRVGKACLATLQGHTKWVSSVAFSRDGSTIVSGSGDQSVKVWDARTGPCRVTLQGHTSRVTSVAVSGDGSTVVSGSWDNTVKVWDSQSGACSKTLEGHTSSVTSVAVSGDGSTVVSGSQDNTVKVWDAQSGACSKRLEGHTSSVGSAALSADGSTLVSGSGDRTVKVWDARTIACRMTLRGHTSSVKSVAFSGDGSTVVSGSGGMNLYAASNDNSVKIWDARTGECRATLQGHASSVDSVAISLDGSTVASGSDITVKVWDARTGTCRATLQGHKSMVFSVALSGDGATVVSGTYDHTVKVWDARTGACRATLQGHTSVVYSVAISGNGSTVVSGSSDKTVRVWDARTGACRATCPRASPEARAAWQSVGAWNHAAQCDIVQGSLHIPDPEVAAPLTIFGPFLNAYGPLVNDKILAFNAKGEAFWFQIRRSKGS